MEKHLKFLPNRQREFLLQVSQTSGYSIEKLAEIAGTCSRNYRDWLREKLSMSLKAADIFCSRFNVILPEDKITLVNRWERLKEKNSRIGGLAAFKKNGCPATPEGRKKGGQRALKILRERGIIPLIKKFKLPENFSSELAEYVGILLGDGGITQGQVAIALDTKADSGYIPFVAKLGIRLFGLHPGILKRRFMNVTVIYYNGVMLVRYLVGIGLKIGNKVKQQVGVPEWIKSSRSYRQACLRGLMDTDGGVFLHNYEVNYKNYSYKKICFSNRSLPLLSFVAEELKNTGFRPRIFSKAETKRVWLYNKQEVERYLKLIGSHNPRLLKYQGTSFGSGRVAPNGKAQVC